MKKENSHKVLPGPPGYQNKYEKKDQNRNHIKCYLVHLGANHLLAVVVLWHHHLHLERFVITATTIITNNNHP